MIPTVVALIVTGYVAIFHYTMSRTIKHAEQLPDSYSEPEDEEYRPR